MKFIPTRDMIDMLASRLDVEILDLKNFEYMLETYGDTYYMEDGSIKLFQANEARKHLKNVIPKVDVDMKWTLCTQELPDKEVLCCDIHNNIMLGYVFVDIKSDSGFSAENNNCFMYECVAWMPKPKGCMEVNDAEQFKS